MPSLGFGKGGVLTAFILESLLLGLVGGVLGVFFASFMQFSTISTMNLQTFSAFSFSFTLTLDIIWKSLLFSLIIGFSAGASGEGGTYENSQCAARDVKKQESF
jgi:ABC-type antimicrobial peptide transport system permease subunit